MKNEWRKTAVVVLLVMAIALGGCGKNIDLSNYDETNTSDSLDVDVSGNTASEAPVVDNNSGDWTDDYTKQLEGVLNDSKNTGTATRVVTPTRGVVPTTKDNGRVIPTTVVAPTVAVNNGDYTAFRNELLNFSWQMAKDKTATAKFLDDVARNFVEITGTTNFTKDDLVSEDKLYVTNDWDDFVAHIRELDTNFDIRPSLFGYNNYKTGKVIINVAALEKTGKSWNRSAGVALSSVLWHEWLHRDTTKRTTGKWLKNDEVGYGAWNYYRGFEVWNDSDRENMYGNEVAMDSVMMRLMIDVVGLKKPYFGYDYMPCGSETFMPLSQAAGISALELYKMYTTSDFEGLCEKIGAVLPGSESAGEKGRKLMTGAFANMSCSELQEAGVYKVAPTKWNPRQ